MIRSSIQTVKVDYIIIDERLQTRVGLDEPTVQAYVALIHDNGGKWPFKDRIELFRINGRLFAVDGFHRTEACHRVGSTTALANIQDGNWQDAIEFALSANASHGLPRSNADKRRTVELALQNDELAKLSTRKLAKVCSVSNAYVSKIKSETVNVNALVTKLQFAGDDRTAWKKALSEANAHVRHEALVKLGREHQKRARDARKVIETEFSDYLPANACDLDDLEFLEILEGVELKLAGKR